MDDIIYINCGSEIKFGGRFMKLSGYKIYYISREGKIKSVHKDNAIFNYKPARADDAF